MPESYGRKPSGKLRQEAFRVVDCHGRLAGLIIADQLSSMRSSAMLTPCLPGRPLTRARAGGLTVMVT